MSLFRRKKIDIITQTKFTTHTHAINFIPKIINTYKPLVQIHSNNNNKKCFRKLYYSEANLYGVVQRIVRYMHESDLNSFMYTNKPMLTYILIISAVLATTILGKYMRITLQFCIIDTPNVRY